MGTGTASAASRGGGLVQQHGELLRRNLLFAGLDGVTLAKLAARLEVVRLEDGDAVMRLGEVGDAMYVISRGHFGVFAGDKRLRTCGQGDGIGEMALLTNQPRSATVRAEGECEVLRLDRQHFDGPVSQNPSVPLALAATLSSRLGGTPPAPEPRSAAMVEPLHPGSFRLGRIAEAVLPLASRASLGFSLAALLLAGGWLVPQPDGFTLAGWHAAATFLAIVPLMAFGCLPDGAIALVLAAAWVLSGVTTPAGRPGRFRQRHLGPDHRRFRRRRGHHLERPVVPTRTLVRRARSRRLQDPGREPVDRRVDLECGRAESERPHAAGRAGRRGDGRCVRVCARQPRRGRPRDGRAPRFRPDGGPIPDQLHNDFIDVQSASRNLANWPRLDDLGAARRADLRRAAARHAGLHRLALLAAPGRRTARRRLAGATGAAGSDVASGVDGRRRGSGLAGGVCHPATPPPRSSLGRGRRARRAGRVWARHPGHAAVR